MTPFGVPFRLDFCPQDGPLQAACNRRAKLDVREDALPEALEAGQAARVGLHVHLRERAGQEGPARQRGRLVTGRGAEAREAAGGEEVRVRARRLRVDVDGAEGEEGVLVRALVRGALVPARGEPGLVGVRGADAGRSRTWMANRYVTDALFGSWPTSQLMPRPVVAGTGWRRRVDRARVAGRRKGRDVVEARRQARDAGRLVFGVQIGGLPLVPSGMKFTFVSRVSAPDCRPRERRGSASRRPCS